MRLIDATALVKNVLIELNKIPVEVVERYGFDAKSPFMHGQSMRGGIRKALRCIEQAHTIDAVPVVHAMWKDHHCSNCWAMCVTAKTPQDFVINVETPYCPNCGAKMDGDLGEDP
jgi:hypothetical protein